MTSVLAKICKILKRVTKKMVPAHQEFIVSLESPSPREQVSSRTGHAAQRRPPKDQCTVSWVRVGGWQAGWALERDKEEGRPDETACRAGAGGLGENPFCE